MKEQYQVQSRSAKGKYVTRIKTESWNQAVLYYNGINIGNGSRKRLLVNGKKYKKPEGETK
jgi:hypothetical protein